MPISVTVPVITALFLVAALCQPLAARLRLPYAAVLAMVGIFISLLAGWAERTLVSGRLSSIGETASNLLDLPISSEVFVFVLLPILLYQGAVGIDVRHLARDSVAILLLAIGAVLLSIILIGGAVNIVTGISLTACLLLGAIVATTDPSAVISMFRELGAPARLTRLVEGESLLNDATAIAAFNALLLALVSGLSPSWGDLGAGIAFGLISGAFGGTAAGFIVARILERLKSYRSAQITLTMATPYAIFAVASTTLLVSGVVAIVAAGITIGAIGRSRFDRNDLRFMRELLDQAADWATGLIFILAALIVPRILSGFEMAHLLPLAVVIAAALIARTIILWGLAPILARMGLMRPVSHAMNAALLWGGLRGAMTLALVLAVAENTAIADDIKRTIAIVATGYTLWTLLVQGTSLRVVVRGLGLTRLSAVEQAFRTQALGSAIEATRERVRGFARRAGIETGLVDSVIEPYETRLTSALSDTVFEEEITDREKIQLGLAALVNQERNLLLEQRWSSGLPSSMIDQYLYCLDTMRDEAWGGGRVGYLRAARLPYRQTVKFRLSNALHKFFRIHAPLARYLGRRFHYLLVNRIIVAQLEAHVETRLVPIFGKRIGDILGEIIHRRRDELERNLEAIRLQYPAFTRDLEHSMLHRYAHHEEIAQISSLLEAGVIAPGIGRSLLSEAQSLYREVRHAGRIDIEHPKPELLRRLRAFEGFSDTQLARVARRMRPVVFPMGSEIYRPGDQIDSIFFISNGAVEVEREGSETIRLGRGQAFGQLRVLNPELKAARVRAIAYSHCFEMKVRDFRELLRQSPEWKAGMTSQRVSAMPAE